MMNFEDIKKLSEGYKNVLNNYGYFVIRIYCVEVFSLNNIIVTKSHDMDIIIETIKEKICEYF